MSLANGDSLFSFLTSCILLIFLLFVLARISRTKLSKSVERGHSCLVPGFKGKAFNYSLFRIMLALSLTYTAFMMLR